jgi:hypothetical protein
MNERLDGDKAVSLLTDAVSSVFAEMAFIDVQGVSTDVNPEQIIHAGIPVPDDERCASIDVLMPLTCAIELKVTTALRDRISETLFADYPGEERFKLAEDSLLEMLNVIAGSFLSSYFGSLALIQLELPRFLFISEAPAGQTVAKVRMNAEGEPVTVTLTSVRYRY